MELFEECQKIPCCSEKLILKLHILESYQSWRKNHPICETNEKLMITMKKSWEMCRSLPLYSFSLALLAYFYIDLASYQSTFDIAQIIIKNGQRLNCSLLIEEGNHIISQSKKLL